MAAPQRRLSPRRLPAALCLASGLLAAEGCSSSGAPSPLDPIRQLTETSEEEERELGLQFDREIDRHVELVDDPVVLAFVDDLGHEILRRVPRPGHLYRFRVVDDPTLNAFAVPGGYVYLHSGTLRAAGSVDELAGVLAHEIGHVKGRHYARMRKRAAIPELLTSLAGIAVAAASGEAGAAVVASGANVALQLHFSREFENEADQMGLDYMTRAGFAPEGLGRFFERIVEEQEKLEPGFEVPPYLYSHPEVENRIVSVETTRRRPARTPSEGWSHRLREVQARLALLEEGDRPGFHREEPVRPDAAGAALERAERLVREGRGEDARGVLQSALAAQPGDPRIHYRLGEQLSEAGRTEEAVAAWRRTLALDPHQAQVHYRLGIAYRDLGDRRRAVFHLEQAARRFARGSDLSERAWFEVEKITFPPMPEAGLARADRLGLGTDAPGPERFSRAGPAAVWWGRLHPRYRNLRDRLQVRWIDPDGRVRREAAPERRDGLLSDRLPLADAATRPEGSWTVEALLEDDVVDRRRFALGP